MSTSLQITARNSARDSGRSSWRRTARTTRGCWARRAHLRGSIPRATKCQNTVAAYKVARAMVAVNPIHVTEWLAIFRPVKGWLQACTQGDLARRRDATRTDRMHAMELPGRLRARITRASWSICWKTPAPRNSPWFSRRSSGGANTRFRCSNGRAREDDALPDRGEVRERPPCRAAGQGRRGPLSALGKPSSTSGRCSPTDAILASAVSSSTGSGLGWAMIPER